MDSKNAHFQVGDYVLGFRGWRLQKAEGGSARYRALARYTSSSSGKNLTKLDPSIAPIQAFLGVLGITAYVGLLDIGRLSEGETVFVSAAAGAVGSLVCQIAKIKGCRVVASAGRMKKLSGRDISKS